jgi:hypothetical protein
MVHFTGDNGQIHTLCSETGVKQGHGLGGVIYAIGKHHVYQDMSDAEGKNQEEVHVVAYQDDAHIVGQDLGALREAVTRWVDGTERLGGRPNRNKCSVYFNNPDSSSSGGTRRRVPFPTPTSRERL